MKVRRLLAVLLSILLLLGLVGCGGSAKSEMAYDSAMPEAPASREELKEMYGESLADSVDSADPSSLPVDRKLIRTVRMEAETEDLDGLLTALESKLSALNGYVQAKEVYHGSTYSSRRYRHADITLRIPAENLNADSLHFRKRG